MFFFSDKNTVHLKGCLYGELPELYHNNTQFSFVDIQFISVYNKFGIASSTYNMSKKLSLCCFKTKQKKSSDINKNLLLTKELESCKQQLIQRIKDAKNLDELKPYTNNVNESKYHTENTEIEI